ncbi:hypothetical protein DFJ73DRAFT_862150 [Zopfochytrium polystomum]|nr:hypothetical protein DFJ73DRAFT_862150 [Zopfochytrium polystomum]
MAATTTATAAATPADCDLVKSSFPGISFPANCCDYTNTMYNSYVNCTDGRVTDIVLSNLNIRGSLSQGLFQLTALRTLNLELNSITGTVPADIGKLTELRYLTLFTNQLSGKLPDVFGSMRNLNTFFIGRNNLSGTIPVSLGTITSLASFGIERQLVYGDVPRAMGSLPNLQNLFIDFTCIDTNSLPGKVPGLSGLHSGSPPVECAAISASLANPTPTSSPKSTSASSPTSTPSNSSSVPIGVIGGAVAGVAVVLILVGAVAIMAWRRQRSKRPDSSAAKTTADRNGDGGHDGTLAESLATQSQPPTAAASLGTPFIVVHSPEAPAPAAEAFSTAPTAHSTGQFSLQRAANDVYAIDRSAAGYNVSGEPAWKQKQLAAGGSNSGRLWADDATGLPAYAEADSEDGLQK